MHRPAEPRMCLAPGSSFPGRTTALYGQARIISVHTHLCVAIKTSLQSPAARRERQFVSGERRTDSGARGCCQYRLKPDPECLGLPHRHTIGYRTIPVDDADDSPATTGRNQVAGVRGNLALKPSTATGRDPCIRHRIRGSRCTASGAAVHHSAGWRWRRSRRHGPDPCSSLGFSPTPDLRSLHRSRCLSRYAHRLPALCTERCGHGSQLFLVPRRRAVLVTFSETLYPARFMPSSHVKNRTGARNAQYKIRPHLPRTEPPPNQELALVVLGFLSVSFPHYRSDSSLRRPPLLNQT
jgi:hypothetical protein